MSAVKFLLARVWDLRSDEMIRDAVNVTEIAAARG